MRVSLDAIRLRSEGAGPSKCFGTDLDTFNGDDATFGSSEEIFSIDSSESSEFGEEDDEELSSDLSLRRVCGRFFDLW